jgi:hypothetical protein
MNGHKSNFIFRNITEVCILIVMKFYTNLYNNKEGNKRLNKNMKNYVYFCEKLYYDGNFAATNFVLEDETCRSICLNFENANIRKNLLCIFQCEFCTYLLFEN